MAAVTDEHHDDGCADASLSVAFFECVFAAMDHAVVVTDLHGRVRYWNQAAERLYGYPAPETLGRSIRELVVSAEGGWPALNGPDQPFAGHSFVGDSRVRDRAGREFTVAVESTPITGPDGAIVGVLGVSHDVTERRRAQRTADEAAGVLDCSGDAILTVDLGLVVRYANRALQRMCGYQREDLVGSDISRLVAPERMRAFADAAEAVSAGSGHQLLPTRVRRGDGTLVDASLGLSPVCDGAGRVVGVSVLLYDPGPLREALRDSEARYQVIAETTQEGIWTVDSGGRTLSANRRLTDILGLSTEMLYARRVPEILAPHDTMLVEQWFRPLREGGVEEYEVTYPHPDGQPRTLGVRVSPLRQSPAMTGVLAMIGDVTAARAAETELNRRALADELTGLANRSVLVDRLEHLLARLTQQPGAVAVLFADLDQFKLVNDSWGHGTGDRLLVQVAARLADAARPGDTIARFGGDEFVVLAENVSEAAARNLAGRMMAALAEPFIVDGQRVHVRASIGIALSPPAPASGLLRFAEAAMYEAKTRGRSRVEVFDVGLADQAGERLELSNDLRDALARDELELQYQPVVDLSTGQLLSVEALARWHHADRGPVSPAKFVEVAEATGLSTMLDRWVLRRVARDAQRLAPAMPGGLCIAVNVSARHLADDDLEAAVLATAHSRSMTGGRLVLEITENAVMDSPERARAMLTRLRHRGVETAIDDFGTGHSSLGYLSRLPVSTLKIDRCFVKDITEDPDALAIATSIMELARAMRLNTIAEGVENVGQLTVLRRLGCAAGQGFLWSPAIRPEELVQLMDRLPERRFMVDAPESVPATNEPPRR